MNSLLKYLINAQSVTKLYGDKYALRNVSLTVRKGECIGIAGRNGSGKSTLVNIITGMKKADAGSVIYGFPVDELKTKLGVQLQETYFEQLFKVRDVINFLALLYNVSKDKRSQLISEFGLENLMGNYAVKLSGGEKQKLNILLTMLHDPEVYIFDEITTGLDAISRMDILEKIKRIKAAGKTILLVSHYFEEIESLCDRVIILQNGNKVFDDETVKINSSQEKTFTQNMTEMIGGGCI